MTKEELIEILQTDETTFDELTAGKYYILQIEVGDMPKNKVFAYLTHLREVMNNKFGTDTKMVFIPTHNGLNRITIHDLKELNK